jgi:steroid delta-isomerase-like uncharacterized protein
MGVMALPSIADLRKRREAIVHDHIAAENRHDLKAAIATFHRPCYDVVPLGAVSDGEQAVHDLLAGLVTGFPDFHVDLKRLHHADQAVVCEFVMSGTHRGPWAGMEASGRRMEIRLVGIFEFEDDRLLCERVYFDMATLVRQLQG